MQKSEGGGLGVGGSPAGFLSARGAADFLSRATAVLATAFVRLSIVLAVLAAANHSTAAVDANAANRVSVPEAGAPVAGAPAGAAPVTTAPAGAAPVTSAPAGAPLTGTGLPGVAPQAGANPLEGVGAATAPAAPAENGAPLQQ
jgi:preprotein translocase subunit SecG